MSHAKRLTISLLATLTFIGGLVGGGIAWSQGGAQQPTGQANVRTVAAKGGSTLQPVRTSSSGAAAPVTSGTTVAQTSVPRGEDGSAASPPGLQPRGDD